MTKKKVNIMVDFDEWKRFGLNCRELDTNASREVRRFVREFLTNHKQLSLDEIAKVASK